MNQNKTNNVESQVNLPGESAAGTRTSVLLKKVLMQVLATAEGQDQNLDTALSDVRAQIASNQLTPMTVDKLDNASRALISVRRSRAEKQLRGFGACVAQMLLLEPPEELRKDLAAFIRDARKVIARSEEQELMPLKYSRLQGQVLESLSSETGAMSALNKEQAIDVEALFPDESLEGLPPFSSIAESIEGILVNMLVEIRVPDKGRQVLDEARQILNAGLNWYELAALLEKIAAVVQIALDDDQQEFERFLRDLDERTRVLFGGVKDVDSTIHSMLENGEVFDQDFRRGIHDLAGGVSGADSLTSLQSSIFEGLDSMVTQLDSFRHERDDMQRQYESQVSTLNSRILELEKKSEEAGKEIQNQQRRNAIDPLTGLPNRGAYDQRIQMELSRWNNFEHDFCLVVADIDYFKAINDEYGHLAGDKVLTVIAKTIRQRLRNVDFIARYGGEEFAIILPNTPHVGALKLMEDLGSTIRTSPFHYNKEPLEVTVSFGIAQMTQGDNGETLFARADEALYQAKSLGRDRCIVGQFAA